MCGHCGCGGESKTTLLDMQSGKAADMGAPHRHDHEHVHADGTRHSHSHGHAHDQDHGAGHEHVHVHADGSSHSHARDHGLDHSHDLPGDHDHHHHEHEHIHAEGTPHSHGHEHGHDHAHENIAHGSRHEGSIVDLELRILAKNDALAGKNRAWFAGREILALNLVSSPGAGKTTLLERTIRDLKRELPFFVLEGDQATANDGERIRAAGAAAVQINTGTGCHLEADMVARGLQLLKPAPGSVVMIENVGNLVCPALFDLGERGKVVILSVTEGEDKPLKYPHMFRAAEIMVLNKIDLLPHVDFDVDAAIANARAVNPSISVLRVSARSGEGMESWYDWLRQAASAAREAAFA